MFALGRKQKPLAASPLTLMSPEGKELYTFAPDVVDSLRRMTTALLYQEKLTRVVACVAALREEGVTYMATALGLILASDLNARVAVLELNWWAPGMRALLSGDADARKSKRAKRAKDSSGPAPSGLGIADVLKERATIEEVRVPTTMTKLTLVPAGDLPENERSSMARSEQLREYITSMEQDFDYILLDVPAVSMTSDAVALASLSQATCVVVHQGITPMTTVKLALDELKHLTILGVVLNKVRISTPRWVLNLLPQE